MLRFPALLFPLVFLALPTPPVLAEPIVNDGIAVDLPPDSTDWVRSDGSSGSVMLQKQVTDEDGEKSAAIIQVGNRITQGGFEANLEAMTKTIPELADEDVMLDSDGITPAGYRIALRDICCGYRDDISLATMVVGLELPDDSQRFLMLLTMNMNSEQRQIVEAEFAHLVRSFRAEGAEPAVLHPENGDGGLEGVYSTLRTGLSLNPFGGMDFNADNVILAFDASGYFSREIPEAGRTIPEHCALTPIDCGTYRLEGGGLFGGAQKITMRDMETDYGILVAEEEAFGRDSDTLKLGGEDFRQLPPFSRDTRFNGTWRYFWAQSGSGAFSSGSVASERILEMRQNGSFTMNGWTGFSTSSDMGTGSVSTAGNSERPVESGRYEVDGYTLRLVGDNGETMQMSLFAPDIGSDELLVLNGNNYLKQDD